MIGKLKGRIDSVETDHLILDVNGVGYLVFASPRLLAACEPGAAFELTIETHVREDHIHLYGFENATERDGFRLLTTVQGVGVRMALALLGHYTLEQLQTIIGAQDKAALTVVSGVGPKLAERILTELKSKVAKLPIGAPPAPAKGKAPAAPASSSDAEDAVTALTGLGYGRTEAFTAVAKAQSDGTEGIDALIKAGLKSLAG